GTRFWRPSTAVGRRGRPRGLAGPYALLFPGQASQHVGMGADFRRTSRAAEAVYRAADQATGLPIGSIAAEGPLERLTDTRIAQPAVVATSLAAMAALGEGLNSSQALSPLFCAGHSVGELAALAAAGAADQQTVLGLVAR